MEMMTANYQTDNLQKIFCSTTPGPQFSRYHGGILQADEFGSHHKNFGVGVLGVFTQKHFLHSDELSCKFLGIFHAFHPLVYFFTRLLL
jgi:hypothetical protein